MTTFDKNTLDDLKHEYRYLVQQLFTLMDERDSILARRMPIIKISAQIRNISTRMQHVDERMFVLLCLPTEFEPRPIIRTTQQGKKIWYDPFNVLVPDWWKEHFENENSKILSHSRNMQKSVPTSQLFKNQ